jgi:hypothetical protein
MKTVSVSVLLNGEPFLTCPAEFATVPRVGEDVQLNGKRYRIGNVTHLVDSPDLVAEINLFVRKAGEGLGE